MISLKRVFESAYERVKEHYHRQAELVLVKPFTVKHKVLDFELKGRIIDSCKETRKISNRTLKGGNSPYITIPCNWADMLTEPLQLHLYQTDKKGILIEEVTEA